MKITIVGDVHWSEKSSLIQGTKGKFTDRLDTLIKTINWCEEQSKNTDMIVYLGDFFDKTTLTDMEITALKEVEWNENIPHYLVLGNHEWGRNGSRNNSANVLIPYKFNVISENYMIETDDTELCFYPYIQDEHRQSLTEMFGEKKKSRIVFSHNDIKGIRYGVMVSTSGVELSDIENNCDLFLNGHLHNGSSFCRNGINVGNICGQNFTEDAFEHNHNLMILDLESRSIELLLNPFAYNFYKVEVNNDKDIEKLHKFGRHSVVSVKCNESYLQVCRDLIENNKEIDYSRIIVVRDNVVSVVENGDNNLDLSVDHLSKFTEFIHSVVGTSDMIEEELNEVLK